MNEKYTLNLDLKGIRRVAITAGFGLKVGFLLCDLAKMLISSTGLAVLKTQAKKGNKTAMDICKEANIKYEKETEDTDRPMNKIGF